MSVAPLLLCALLSLCVFSRADAQSAPSPRWTVRGGLTGEVYRGIDETTYATLSARVTTTGPLEWNLAAGAHGVGLVHRGAEVSVAIYCPVSAGGECLDFNDHSQLAPALMFGASVRLTHLPRALNRLIADVGTGAYYARWTNLPSYYADRPAVFTGYRTADLGVRVTKHVGVLVGVTQFRNVRHRDDQTVGRIGAEVRWPSPPCARKLTGHRALPRAPNRTNRPQNGALAREPAGR